MKKKAKYMVSYTSGATGFGWDECVSTIKEVELLLQEIRTNHSAHVRVFDTELEDYIFYKRALSSPEIDLIFNQQRDLRTKTRKVI